MKQETKKSNFFVIVLILTVAMTAVCIAYAVRTAQLLADGGSTSDAVFSLVVTAVLAVFTLFQIRLVVKYRRTEKEAKRPVYYMMVSGPNENEAEKPKKITGKMPPKDH